MKLTILLIFAFIALSTCHIPLLARLEDPDWEPEVSRNRTHDFLNFLEALYNHFDLPAPAQINKCFNNLNSDLYFRLIQTTNRILQDTKDRSSFKLHLELIKLAVLHKSLESTYACMIMTQDFSDLLYVLNVPGATVDELRTGVKLFYQAHYIDLIQGMQPVIENINKKIFKKAGDAFGTLLEKVVNTTAEEGIGHLALAGFSNGYAIGLDIEEPEDSLECYDDEAAFNIIEYAYGLVSAVAEGTVKESTLNTRKFVEGPGKEILSRIPDKVFKCEMESKDHDTAAQSLGIDVASDEFRDRLVRYINDNRFQYYAVCKALKQALDNGNLHHAGTVEANFFKAVAAWKS